MPKLLLASANPGKVKEYRFLLSNLGYQITTLAEQGISKAAIESGNSYKQNARMKATTYTKLSQLISLTDDSGLEVDALNGEPLFEGADTEYARGWCAFHDCENPYQTPLPDNTKGGE